MGQKHAFDYEVETAHRDHLSSVAQPAGIDTLPACPPKVDCGTTVVIYIPTAFDRHSRQELLITLPLRPSPGMLLFYPQQPILDAVKSHKPNPSKIPPLFGRKTIQYNVAI